MAKQANTPVVSDEIVSLKDGAYKQASANDRVVSVAKYVMDKVCLLYTSPSPRD